MFHRKKPTDNLSASTVALMTGFGLLLGVLIGVSVVPQGLQKSSAPTPEPTLRTSAVSSYTLSQSCDCDYDAGIGTTLGHQTTISYYNAGRNFNAAIYLENYGNRTVTNVAWRAFNNTTGQLLTSGSFGSIPSHTGYKVFDGAITRAADGSALKLWQGDHSIKFEITNYDQKNTEGTNNSRVTNNTYTQNVHVPVVDLTPTAYTPTSYGTGDTMKLYHLLTVANSGDNTVSSGAFASEIQLNGVRDATINFSSITGGSYSTPTRVLGTAYLSSGYNFIRGIVDTNGSVIERNESRNQTETNNVTNRYVHKDPVNGNVTNDQYSASQTWFMKTPYVQPNSNTIAVPVINISSASQIISPILSLNQSGSCQGSELKRVTLGSTTIQPNATSTLLIRDLTTTEIQTINNYTVCVIFMNGDNIKRNFYAGFPDLTVTNYQTSLTQVSPAKFVYLGNLGNSTITNSIYGLVHRVTVKNNGNAKATNIKVDVYSNGTYDNDNGTSYTINELAEGAEQTVTIQPEDNALVGYNIVKIKLDRQSSIAETNEDNNIAYREVKIDGNQATVRNYTDGGKNYYLYRPYGQINNTTKTYITPVTIIADTAQEPYVKFEYFTSNNVKLEANFSKQTNPAWQPGEFRGFNIGPYPSSDCFSRFNLFVRNEGQNFPNPQFPEYSFPASDISQGNQCL